MSISKQIFSRLFLPQAVAALLIFSSFSLSAMEWDGEFRPHDPMAAVAGKRESEPGPEEAAAPADEVEAKSERKEEQVRNIPAGPYRSKLKEILEENLRICKIVGQLAADMGQAEQMAVCGAAECTITRLLRSNLQPGSENQEFLTQKEAQDIQQTYNEWNVGYNKALKDGLEIAYNLGRHDLARKLLNKPTMLDRLPKFSPEAVGLVMIFGSIGLSALAHVFKSA